MTETTPDLNIRTAGRAGRITLTRPKALNALSWQMCLDIEAALDAWAGDDSVAVVVIDAEGDRAFCAGGDVAEIHRRGTAGDYDYGCGFWRDEYRLNAKLAEYPKPIVALMQGFVMGGGVGLGCHVSHRIVGETTQMAMPEVGIGLIPDVGGSLLLANAPGLMGRYLALTAGRMGPGDAIHAGFADLFIPESTWPGVIAALEDSGEVNDVRDAAQVPPAGPLAAEQPWMDATLGGDLPAILAQVSASDGPLAEGTAKAIRRNSPLAMDTTLALLELQRGHSVREALALEYRATYRSLREGDFLEGVRAQLIDKDRNPQWRNSIDSLPPGAGAALLAPLEAELAI